VLSLITLQHVSDPEVGGLGQDAAERSLQADGARMLEVVADGRVGSDLIPSRLYQATR
jgi:hypothetical protein